MEIGNVTIKACGATMDLFDIKLSDLEPIVSEVTGVATFIEDSRRRHQPCSSKHSRTTAPLSQAVLEGDIMESITITGN